MTRVGVSERKLEGKFANRQQEQIRGGFARRACQKKAGEVEEGRGRKFMSMRPDDPETGEVQAHKNALCTPPATLAFTPLCFFPSVSFSLYFPPSLRWRLEAHSSLMFWVLVCGCRRSRQPHFLNGGVTEVNKAGWPSASLHLSPVELG